MTVATLVPNLGDLCDVSLVTQQHDPFAVARLLQRWLEPAPNIDAVRALTVLEVQEYFATIAAHVHEHGLVLLANAGKQKH